MTRTGPIGRNVSEPLARSHWPSPFSPSRKAGGLPCQSRARDVVDDDVAGDVVHRLVLRDAAGGLADDDAQLDLEVERMAALGPDDRLAVADDRVRELREQQRPIGDVPAGALGDVRPIVEPDADDLSRSFDRRSGHFDQLGAADGLGLAADDAGAAAGDAGAADPLGAADEPGAALDPGAAHCGSGGATNAPSASSRSDSVA